MNRTRTFLGALLTAAILTAAALAGTAAAAPVQLKGYEVGIVGDTSTFVGLIPSTSVWKATITHDPLNTKPNAVTDITGGSFVVGAVLSFNWFSLWSVTNPAPLPPPQSLSIASGEIVAGPSVGGSDFCTQAFRISGTIAPSGTFSGTLKHYGEKVNGTCEADFASVTVTVTAP